jgi:hypothetical protein
MFDSPDAYSLLGFRSTDGERFQASAIFEGDNRFPSALLTVFVGKSAPNTGGGQKRMIKSRRLTAPSFML